jgi:hypothetical protein
MPRPSQIILLVEDDRHQQFLFRYLRRVGLGIHAIRIVKSPSGAGSAEQWVRERFPIEVEACRTRQAQTKLIILIDADKYTVQQRIQQLDQTLQQAGMAPIDNGAEDIARLVPKRNIETWILNLNDVVVDEDADYKGPRVDWVDLIRVAIGKLYAWTRPNSAVPMSCVASLQTGIRELQKLQL